MIETYLAKRKNSLEFFDEMATTNGNLSSRWEKLAQHYNQVSPEKMEANREDVVRQLRENGVTYNVYGDPDGMNRQWVLDPVPMVFESDEWSVIERGLTQRSELLNYVLKDLYGERKLIREGFIPFELIYNHKGFLRQADKIQLTGSQQLIQYSADLARGPDGRMWVLHDRTDAPSGAGYTFENRAAMTRVFPDLLRENQIRKISSYYQTLKHTLVDLSSRNVENPRIVMLSPGPANETFFEHAYLSSLLGFTLAFGEDLTVSDGYVWLKTIKGLEKVDVIIRRVDDVYCDPLEFRGDSHLGVVGLMEAIRQKKVTVINPLGARVLENPGLMAFLPRICQKVMGESLILPSVATWWCGQNSEKQYVLDHFDKLVIRQIYRDDANKAVFGGDLTKDQKAQLIAAIKRDPYLYVGQEMVNFSTTPSWIDQQLAPRNAVVRTYVVADTEQESYKVMPGGLARSAPDTGVFLLSNLTGGISKDAWVMGKANDSSIVKLTTAQTVVQTVTRNIIPSRTGERLFWLGRYLERSAYTVRMMRMTLHTYNEADEDIHENEYPVLSILLRSLSTLTGTLPGFTKRLVLRQPEDELLSLAADPMRVGSLAQCIQSLLNNAFAVRDRLSLDTWRILDSIKDELGKMQEHGGSLTRVYGVLDDMIIKLMAFYGLNIDNMTREPTWHLLNIGRFIESAINNATVLSSMLGKKVDRDTERYLMEDTLRFNESLVTYRYLYRSNMAMNGVVELLILNENNPRSLIYQLLKIQEHLNGLPDLQEGNTIGLVDEKKRLLEAITKVRLADSVSLSQLNPELTKYTTLTKFLGEIIGLLKEVSNLIFEKYFNHTGNRYTMIQTSLPEI